MDAQQWNDVALECPIDLDWMDHPVQALDFHMYEKSAILAHLAAQDNLYPPAVLAALNPQERVNVLLLRSPFRGANIQVADLIEKKDYYDKIFIDLKKNYNEKVIKQRDIFSKAQANELSMPLTSEESSVVNFYSATQAKRNAIANGMRAILLQSDLPEQEQEAGEVLLKAASKIPVLI